MSEIFPPTPEITAHKEHLAGDSRLELTNRLATDVPAGFSLQNHLASDQYHHMHKHFVGPKTVSKLLSIHDQLATTEGTDYLTTAGWAAAEAALVATDRPTEDRLSYVQLAFTSWQRAIEHQRHRNTLRGLEEDYQNANTSRLQLVQIFVPLMEGMVKGDVTKQIRHDVYANLLLLSVQNAVGLIEAAAQGRECGPHKGLAHELNAMLAVNRLHSPTLIAMPATARADNGNFYPDQTHDIELLHLYRGKILGVTTLESKPRPREKHYRRYKAAIVGGRIHLYTKTGTSPVDTVQLFLKEQEGSITSIELHEIDHMTDIIVHLARHQLSSAPNVSPHCRDVDTCDKIPQHRSNKPLSGLGGLAIAS